MQLDAIDKVDLRNEAVHALLLKYVFVCLQDTLELFVYQDGIYVGKGLPERLITEAVRQKLGDNCTKNDVVEAVAMVKDKSFQDPDFFEGQNVFLVCVQNGVLDVGKTFPEFLPHDSKYHFLNKIPIDWVDFSTVLPVQESRVVQEEDVVEPSYLEGVDQSAKILCPRIDQFFHQILGTFEEKTDFANDGTERKYWEQQK